MGYRTRNNGQIKTFWPDDTYKEFYLTYNATMKEIVERCREKWGRRWKLEDIQIEALNIHTDCLTYNLYDSGDYTQFLCITNTSL